MADATIELDRRPMFAEIKRLCVYQPRNQRHSGQPAGRLSAVGRNCQLPHRPLAAPPARQRPEKDPDLHRLYRHDRLTFPVSKTRFLFFYLLAQLLPHKAFSYLKGRALYVAVRMKAELVASAH